MQKYNGYPDVSQCLSYGHFTSTSGINATTACCSCHCGYDVVHGGGYRGSLLGKILRFGVATYTDSLAHDGSTGIIYNFMIDLASSRGFGLLQKDLTYLNDTAALRKLSADTYEACMEVLDLSLVDRCIGPYKNESLFTSLHPTEELYSEEYILLVNPTSPGFSGYVSAPFRPIGYNQLSIRSPLPIIA